MRICFPILLGCVGVTIGLPGCRQPYYGPINKANLGLLVVDGIIINGLDSTIVNLSRTQNINDSATSFSSIPETNAIITVVGENGDIYPLFEQGAGKYAIDQLNLNNNERYWLNITT